MIILILKYFTKNVVEKDKYTFIFKSQFCNLPEIWFKSFKISFNFTFHGVFPWYKGISQILSQYIFAHLGDKLWPVTKVSKDLA